MSGVGPRRTASPSCSSSSHCAAGSTHASSASPAPAPISSEATTWRATGRQRHGDGGGGAPARSAWLSACRGPWRLVRLLLSFCANCTAFTVAPVPLCFFAFFAMRAGGLGGRDGKDLLFPLRWTSRPPSAPSDRSQASMVRELKLLLHFSDDEAFSHCSVLDRESPIQSSTRCFVDLILGEFLGLNSLPNRGYCGDGGGHRDALALHGLQRWRRRSSASR